MLPELWNDLRYRLRALTRGADLDREMEDEIQAHLAREAEALERRGLSAAEARRQARLAFGSDAPVESPNPFLGLHAAVTRQREDGSPSPEGWYPEQRLTLSEALHAYTTGAAYAAHAEGRLGRLAPGFAADLIVLKRDPFACHPSEIVALRPSATMIAGEWVWQA